METQTAYPMTLNGKRIVVLGGTSGMGFATAEMAAREGAAIGTQEPRSRRMKRLTMRCRTDTSFPRRVIGCPQCSLPPGQLFCKQA